jgi:para-nitrobenzyl esterase
MKKILFTVICTMISCVFASAQPMTETTVRQGKVRGVLEKGLGYFKAIPFAEAPTGDLRWKAPVPKKAWEGTYDATEYGAMPPQHAFQFPGAPEAKVSEDCLYLNVITPASKPGENLPVLAWIHGGGFITGDANSNDGDNFAKQGIVFVSISYRTGALGFLSCSELSEESGKGISGNYGLMDMILALKWIQENISSFGGDPSKVTIMGESAGAIAVSMLCASPLAKGLFRGAISESGGSFCPVDSVRIDNNGIRDMTGSEAYGQAWMKRIGAKSLDQLRSMPWEDLIKDEQSGGVGGFWPCVDGYVITDDQYKLYEAGNYNDVNILIGTNSDEGAMFSRPVAIAKYRSDIKAEYDPFADRMLELYPATTDEETFGALSDIFRETAFAWPSYAWARLQEKTGKGKVYVYYFDRYNPEGRVFGMENAKPRGANHASEMKFVFGHGWGPMSQEDADFSKKVNSYWANFVKTGNPNGEGLLEWPTYAETGKTVMYFGNEGMDVIETPNMPQLRLMEEYFSWKRASWKGRQEVHKEQPRPQGGFEANISLPEVYRDANVVFRKIDDHTWVGSGHVMASETLYLLEGKKRAILIDTGTHIPDLDKIVAGITDKPLTVLLTHVHPDHAGGVGPFPEVWINEADTVNVPSMMGGYKGKIKYLKNGQKFNLGGRILETHFTPGNTPGSTTFFIRKEHVGFSGDSYGNGNLLLTTDFSTLLNMCKESSVFFQKAGIEKFYNGHFFGSNFETIKRIDDLARIAEDVLSGKLEGEKTPGMLGLDHVIVRDGVRVNYGEAQVK